MSFKPCRGTLRMYIEDRDAQHNTICVIFTILCAKKLSAHTIEFFL